MKQLMFYKELMLIKQMRQTNVIFVAIGNLKTLVLSLSYIFAMVVMIQCKKLWVLLMLQLFMLKEVLKEFTFGPIPNLTQLA